MQELHGYLGIGSNLGDRQRHITRALALLDDTPLLSVVAVSSVYESPAWGYASEHSFLNIVVETTWQCTPQNLQHTCSSIEKALGRVPGGQDNAQAYADRAIDIDILALGGLKLDESELTLPHPRAHLRAFVLKPWIELAPKQQLRGRSLTDWLAELPRDEVEAVHKAQAQAHTPSM